jgi:hypothetical protein
MNTQQLERWPCLLQPRSWRAWIQNIWRRYNAMFSFSQRQTRFSGPQQSPKHCLELETLPISADCSGYRGLPLSAQRRAVSDTCASRTLSHSTASKNMNCDICIPQKNPFRRFASIPRSEQKPKSLCLQFTLLRHR